MGFGRTRAVALTGVQGQVVVVEAQGSQGLPAFTVGGLPDAACAQAPDRVRAAARNSGVGIPLQRWTVNLSPASLPKSGSGFDLANAAPWRCCLQGATMSTTTEPTVGEAQTVACPPWCTEHQELHYSQPADSEHAPEHRRTLGLARLPIDRDKWHLWIYLHQIEGFGTGITYMTGPDSIPRTISLEEARGLRDQLVVAVAAWEDALTARCTECGHQHDPALGEAGTCHSCAWEHAKARRPRLVKGQGRWVEAPEVGWHASSQTWLAECGCGWRYFASTLRHAQARASEHRRDDH